jgi:radical SAM-linked protein
LWQALEVIDGVYVPARFDMEFDEAGRLRAIVPRGRRRTVARRVLDDLNRVAVPPFPLVPACQIVHDRLNLEISRGCTRGCRYCQAGMVYRPVRERDPAAALAWLEAALAATGFEEVSLLSLSIGDYRPLAGLLQSLMDRLARSRVAVSLPSMRADTLTPEMMAQIQRVRRTGLTLAPEAGSQRLRQVINKNLTETAIMDSARRAFAAGWQLLKLYFMIGLPRETREDREGIPVLARQILAAAPRGHRPRLNVSLSSFIPKPHTPFQWERQEDLKECRRRLHGVKDRLRQKNLQTKWNSAAQTWLEGVFSRGDRRLAPVLLEAYRRGCRLDAWSEYMRLEPWREAFLAAGVAPEFYLRERHPEEVLPWDHVDAGVSREFLLAERARAEAGVETPDCRQEGCQDCGVCDQVRINLKLQEADAWVPVPSPPRAVNSGEPQRYRLTYAKLEEARWLGHLELVAALYRSLRRSGLPLVFSAGFHPLPRVSFHGALPVGVESLVEFLDLELAEPVEDAALVATLNRVLPAGVKVLQAYRLARRLAPPGQEGAVYQVASATPVFTPQAAAHFLAQEEFMVTRHRPREDKRLDLRRLVAGLRVMDPSHLELDLRRQEQGNLKVTDALAAIFALGDDQTRELRIVKTRNI